MATHTRVSEAYSASSALAKYPFEARQGKCACAAEMTCDALH